MPIIALLGSYNSIPKNTIAIKSPLDTPVRSKLQHCDRTISFLASSYQPRALHLPPQKGHIKQIVDWAASSRQNKQVIDLGTLTSRHRLGLRISTPSRAHKNWNQGKSGDRSLRITSDKDVEASFHDLDDCQGLEAGVIPESRLLAEDPSSTTAQASTSGRAAYSNGAGSILYPPAQRNHIRESW